jgi:hypothetical protein
MLWTCKFVPQNVISLQQGRLHGIGCSRFVPQSIVSSLRDRVHGIRCLTSEHPTSASSSISPTCTIHLLFHCNTSWLHCLVVNHYEYIATPPSTTRLVLVSVPLTSFCPNIRMQLFKSVKLPGVAPLSSSVWYMDCAKARAVTL